MGGPAGLSWVLANCIRSLVDGQGSECLLSLEARPRGLLGSGMAQPCWHWDASGGRELQVRESVPHLCPPSVVPIPTYFLCHMLLAVTYLKRQLLHPQCFHICDYFQPHNY